jgi:hypothetical protein
MAKQQGPPIDVLDYDDTSTIAGGS